MEAGHSVLRGSIFVELTWTRIMLVQGMETEGEAVVLVLLEEE